MIPAISIAQLTKFYRRYKALDNVSFEVMQGEFFGFLGPNGAGKTTTINAITGLANYQGGKVEVFGHDATRDYRKTRAVIGLVPQEFNFDPFLTAEQILIFEGGYFGIPRPEARNRAHQLLELFGLWPNRGQDYKRLSGGMKRRLLIARALMHRPRILILDEPTAGVDLELRYRLWDFLKKMNREGTTVFLTTHYIEEAERLCNRIGVIHQGKMVALDETEALIRKMSRDQVELYLKRELSEIPDEIRFVPVVLEEEGRKLRFEESNNAVSEVLKALHSRGLEIERIDVRRPTLEDAFLKLIHKKK
jgi:ABC-2 type transport system ATP-binding protein